MLNPMDIVSALGSLLIIILVICATYYGSRWYARKMGPGGLGRYVKIIERTNVSSTSSIMVVKVGEKFFLIGVSDKNMQLLSELNDFEQDTEIENSSKSAKESFSYILNGMINAPKNLRTKVKNRNDGDSK